MRTERHCEENWLIMRGVLKQSRIQGIQALCELISSPANGPLPLTAVHRINILRGGVFFLGMACWGSQRIKSFEVPRSLLLPAFAAASARSVVA